MVLKIWLSGCEKQLCYVPSWHGFGAFKNCISHHSHSVAFETDEDEDGDRITVRSDEEMKAMLSYVSLSQMRAMVMW